jgi:hypothetical protein
MTNSYYLLESFLSDQVGRALAATAEAGLIPKIKLLAKKMTGRSLQGKATKQGMTISQLAKSPNGKAMANREYQSFYRRLFKNPNYAKSQFKKYNIA